MIDWCRALPNAQALGPVVKADLSAWPNGGFAQECQHLRYCPIGASELLIIAQMLPLEVIRTAQGPQLVADLNPSQLKPLAFTKDGDWAFSYKPVALRMLPFLTFADGSTGRLPSTSAYPDVARGQALQNTMERIIRLGARDMQRATGLIERAFDADFLTWAEDSDVAVKAPRLLLSPDDLRIRLSEAAAYRVMAAMEFSHHIRTPQRRLRKLGAQRDKPQGTEEENFSFLSFDSGIFFE